MELQCTATKLFLFLKILIMFYTCQHPGWVQVLEHQRNQTCWQGSRWEIKHWEINVPSSLGSPETEAEFNVHCHRDVKMKTDSKRSSKSGLLCPFVWLHLEGKQLFWI